jgi:signal transduction histidine kinase
VLSGLCSPKLNHGEAIEIEQAKNAGREAVTFAGRHHFNEAMVIPLVTVLPVGLYLWYVENAPFSVLTQITIAAFLGISVSLICTFFVIERCMRIVIRFLLVRGIPIEFDAMPQGRLRVRMIVSFSLIIMVTATMIGSLASQRAMDIIQQPERRIDAISNLREHTIYFSIVAVVVGVAYSVMLSNSIASRSGQLVEAMKQVQQGSLARRVEPTGTDEIDVLTRQFNLMVEQLDRNDHVIRDLNANLEQKVKQRTQKLLESEKSFQKSLQKLQEYDQLKTDFFSNVSHELRTPLTMILSPIERILDRDARQLSPEIVSRLETTRINGHRLLKLINQLLDFSKLEAGHGSIHRSSVAVHELITKIVDTAQPLAEQLGVELETNLEDGMAIVSIDEEKIDTVISNLLSNALKFTPPGGTVQVETSLQNDQLQVGVSDTGIGIAAEDHQRIFDRFVQVDGSLSRETAGTGLGMALAKELIEMHGGCISLKSTSGKGSRFWFRIPVKTDETKSTTNILEVLGSNRTSPRISNVSPT